MEKPDSEIHKQEEPDVGLGILRFMGILLLVDIIALVLGVAFFLIAHGIAMTTLRLAVHWQPAHRLVKRLALGTSTSGTAAPLTTISKVSLLISIAIRVSLISLGVWLLFDLGFLGQNIIWIATH